MGFVSRVATTGLLALAVSGGYRLLHNRNFTERLAAGGEAPRPSSSIESEHFAPAENLERIELAELRAAVDRLRSSRAPLNIAMYAFTDRAIGELLTEEADAGTVIRVYRDGEQYEAEEREAKPYGRGSVTSMFRGHSKHSGPGEACLAVRPDAPEMLERRAGIAGRQRELVAGRSQAARQ